MYDSILIIDFGSQVTQLIARRLREAGVFTEILPCTADPKKIKAVSPNGIILSGGPNSVALANTPRAPEIVFDLEVPVLGICYGQQTMCAQLGGREETPAPREGLGDGHAACHGGEVRGRHPCRSQAGVCAQSSGDEDAPALAAECDEVTGLTEELCAAPAP